MKTRPRLSLAIGLSAPVSALAARSLPDQLATHWSAASEPDRTMASTLTPIDAISEEKYAIASRGH